MQGAHGHFPFANGDHSCLQMGGAEVVYSYWFPMKYFSKNYIEVSCWHHIRPHAIGPLSQAMHPRDHAASDEACRGVPLHGSASAELHCLTVLVANACGLLPLWCVQLRSEGNSGLQVCHACSGRQWRRPSFICLPLATIQVGAKNPQGDLQSS